VSLLVLAHRRSLNKVAKRMDGHDVDWNMVFALRLAALFHRSRADIALPALQVKFQGKKFRLTVDQDWLARNPLTVTALNEEVREWEEIGFELRVPGLDEIETGTELAA